jgi:hypothetical protein
MMDRRSLLKSLFGGALSPGTAAKVVAESAGVAITGAQSVVRPTFTIAELLRQSVLNKNGIADFLRCNRGKAISVDAELLPEDIWKLSTVSKLYGKDEPESTCLYLHNDFLFGKDSFFESLAKTSRGKEYLVDMFMKTTAGRTFEGYTDDLYVKYAKIAREVGRTEDAHVLTTIHRCIHLHRAYLDRLLTYVTDITRAAPEEYRPMYWGCYYNICPTLRPVSPGSLVNIPDAEYAKKALGEARRVYKNRKQLVESYIESKIARMTFSYERSKRSVLSMRRGLELGRRKSLDKRITQIASWKSSYKIKRFAKNAEALRILLDAKSLVESAYAEHIAAKIDAAGPCTNLAADLCFRVLRRLEDHIEVQKETLIYQIELTWIGVVKEAVLHRLIEMEKAVRAQLRF